MIFSSFAENVDEMRRIIVDLSMLETAEEVKDITRQMREIRIRYLTHHYRNPWKEFLEAERKWFNF